MPSSVLACCVSLRLSHAVSTSVGVIGASYRCRDAAPSSGESTQHSRRYMAQTASPWTNVTGSWGEDEGQRSAM